MLSGTWPARSTFSDSTSYGSFNLFQRRTTQISGFSMEEVLVLFLVRKDIVDSLIVRYSKGLSEDG